MNFEIKGDWSSDVCSSDLIELIPGQQGPVGNLDRFRNGICGWAAHDYSTLTHRSSPQKCDMNYPRYVV
jgi:hypothetical protein